MVIDTIIQNEINRIEQRIYTIQNRPYYPKFKERILSGKLYARHDCPDETLFDPDLEFAIYKWEMFVPKEKYKEPVTTNMEYGWNSEPRVMRSKFNFHFPKKSCPVTRIGSLFAQEDQKLPKKVFTGKKFLF